MISGGNNNNNSMANSNTEQNTPIYNIYDLHDTLGSESSVADPDFLWFNQQTQETLNSPNTINILISAKAYHSFKKALSIALTHNFPEKSGQLSDIDSLIAAFNSDMALVEEFYAELTAYLKNNSDGVPSPKMAFFDVQQYIALLVYGALDHKKIQDALEFKLKSQPTYAPFIQPTNPQDHPNNQTYAISEKIKQLLIAFPSQQLTLMKLLEAKGITDLKKISAALEMPINGMPINNSKLVFENFYLTDIFHPETFPSVELLGLDQMILRETKEKSELFDLHIGDKKNQKHIIIYTDDALRHLLSFEDSELRNVFRILVPNSPLLYDKTKAKDRGKPYSDCYIKMKNQIAQIMQGNDANAKNDLNRYNQLNNTLLNKMVKLTLNTSNLIRPYYERVYDTFINRNISEATNFLAQLDNIFELIKVIDKRDKVQTDYQKIQSATLEQLSLLLKIVSSNGSLLHKDFLESNNRRETQMKAFMENLTYLLKCYVEGKPNQKEAGEEFLCLMTKAFAVCPVLPAAAIVASQHDDVEALSARSLDVQRTLVNQHVTRELEKANPKIFASEPAPAMPTVTTPPQPTKQGGIINNFMKFLYQQPKSPSQGGMGDTPKKTMGPSGGPGGSN